VGGGPSSRQDPIGVIGWGGLCLSLGVCPVPFAAAASSAAGNGGAGAGGKVGLPALDVALAFPQATPASLFLPAGEMPPSLPPLPPVSVVPVVRCF
jgi:hypothetical protein